MNSIRALVLLLLACGGCRQILGIDTDGVECGSFPFASATCGECAASECCPQSAACESSPPCRDAFACLVRCDGEAAAALACRAACRAAHPEQFDDTLAALASCQAGACGPTCAAYPYLEVSCGTCVERSCAVESARCAASAGCLGLAFCLRRCAAADLACPNTCLSLHRDGAVDEAALAACARARCGGDCG